MITIKRLNKQSLLDFIYSKEYEELEHIPITRHRALSHIKNPRAKETDTLLLLAYEEQNLVGYLGVLADELRHSENAQHCGWLSCLWINENYRGRQIAFRLLEDCAEAWNKKLLVTEFTVPAKKLYDKSGIFADLQSKVGIRLYVRAELSKLLPPKREFFQKVKPILKLADNVFNALFDLRFNVSSNKLIEPTIEYVNEIDDEIASFITERQHNQLFKRGIDELNWVVKNPWVLASAGNDTYSDRYHFSSLDLSFEFIMVKVFSPKKELTAFLIFSKRNRNLKLPYCYHADAIDSVVDVINHHIVKWRINTFTTFNNELASALQQQRTPALLTKQVRRNYIIGKTLNLDTSSEFTIQDGDADCSFT